VRGDTGALVAGVREYGGLTPALRSTLRTNRVVRECLVLLGGAAPLPLFVVLVRLGAANALPAVLAPLFVLGAPIAALLVAVGLERLEVRAVGATRRALARRRRKEEFGKLVEPWYVSFDAIREDQPLGRGRAGGSGLGWGAGLAAVAAGVLAVVALFPFWLLAAIGPAYWDLTGSWIPGLLDKVTAAQWSRRFAASADSTISPLGAGEALHALSVGWDGPGREPTTFSRPRPSAYPPLPMLRDSVLFPRSRNWAGPDEARILELAMRGFSPVQLEWLRGLAVHPAWQDFHTVARAPRLDVLGATISLPLPGAATTLDLRNALPRRFDPLRRMAFANTSRAALLLADGRRVEAEEALKETIAFALRLVDDGVYYEDAATGIVLAGIGRQALIHFYTVTDRPERIVLQAFRDSLRNEAERTASGSGERRTQGANPMLDRTEWMQSARDPGTARPVRLAQLMYLDAVTCTNLRELIFGPGKDVDSVFARAGRDLLRSPADSAFFEILQRQSRRGPPRGIAAWAGGPLDVSRVAAIGATRVIGSALGNPRLAGCFELAAAGAFRPSQTQ
jgi:hypothetical protein